MAHVYKAFGETGVNLEKGVIKEGKRGCGDTNRPHKPTKRRSPNRSNENEN